ncbi:PPC domain-containing protein [Nocardioides sp. C4-1]|uniref:PPC domain-containing protein n=1 Tax=Nocardioides sp. C4-1 TaxID=3151851 RepID=UPI0032670C64
MIRPARRSRAIGPVGLTLTALVVAGTAVAAPSAQDDAPLTSAQQQALDAGFQVAPKSSGAKARAASSTGANPFLANLPDVAGVDFAAWKATLTAAGEARSATTSYREARAQANAVTPAANTVVVHDEQEPAGTAGSNDSLANAERISAFGTAKGKSNVVRIIGEQAQLPTPTPQALEPAAEDNGSIPLAADTGISGVSAVTTTGQLGDGPHGSAGTGSNDFDVYAVDLTAGLSLVADTSGQATDTILALYDAAGELVAADDDGGAGLASLLSYDAATTGTHYLLVAGYSAAGPLPADPADSGSGAGGADEGPYDLAITQSQLDRDAYAVKLRPGDVVGGVANGQADELTVYRPDGSQAVGAPGTDASSLYAPESPLPGGGNTTFGYVAEEAGWYVIDVAGLTGAYSVQIEGYRPGAQLDRNKNQTVLLDFEGGRVNTGLWGGPGVRELSPFSAFLGKWGITRDRERALINRITTVVRANLEEVGDGGLNDPRVTVVNSRTHPELRGKENVSRVVVGGTIDQSGISTIGIAQYIDPGNYGHEDTALVLLDVLSDPTGPASLNTYLTAASDREKFVANGVGNVTAHEIGHMIGSYHTDNASETVNLMDSGGANFQNLFGVGPDGIGGTADDPNVRFVEDTYSPVEGFTGTEDTQNVTAWAYPPR